MKISIKLGALAIGCSNVATAGGGVMVWRQGWATVGWVGISAGGIGAIVGVSATSQNNASWAVPIYPIFEDEKSKASDEKSVKRKIAKKDRHD